MTQEQRIVVLEELVAKQEEYISFLNDENETPISIAFAHGWRIGDQAFLKGKQYRDRISELKEKVNNK